jgi:hypothetical protein
VDLGFLCKRQEKALSHIRDFWALPSRERLSSLSAANLSCYHESIDILEWGARNENANFSDGDFGGGDSLCERLCNGKMLW